MRKGPETIDVPQLGMVDSVRLKPDDRQAVQSCRVSSLARGGQTMPLKNMRGAAAVEFALILPIFLVLVFGIIEFGFLLYNQAMITNAAREGARAGITIQEGGGRMSAPQITQIVNDYCADFLVTFSSIAASPDTDVKINGVTADPAVVGMTSIEDFLTVEVTYDYDFLLIPSLITNLTDQKTLLASATMRAE